MDPMRFCLWFSAFVCMLLYSSFPPCFTLDLLKSPGFRHVCGIVVHIALGRGGGEFCFRQYVIFEDGKKFMRRVGVVSVLISDKG